MSWIGCLPWSETIKKRACRYLLQRYLGQFLEEKLTLDQLTVDLYNGTGRVTNVSLDVQVSKTHIYTSSFSLFVSLCLELSRALAYIYFNALCRAKHIHSQLNPRPRRLLNHVNFMQCYSFVNALFSSFFNRAIFNANFCFFFFLNFCSFCHYIAHLILFNLNNCRH